MIFDFIGNYFVIFGNMVF